MGKITGEYYARALEIYGLKTVCLRYFNVYGPKERSQIGVFSSDSDIDLQDPGGIAAGDLWGWKSDQRLLNVRDVVKANILAMEKESVVGVFNIACGKRTSLNQLARIIMDIMGSGGRPDPRPAQGRETSRTRSRTYRSQNGIGLRAGL